MFEVWRDRTSAVERDVTASEGLGGRTSAVDKHGATSGGIWGRTRSTEQERRWSEACLHFEILPPSCVGPQIGLLYEALAPHRRVVNGGPPRGSGSQCLDYRKEKQTLRALEFPSCECEGTKQDQHVNRVLVPNTAQVSLKVEPIVVRSRYGTPGCPLLCLTIEQVLFGTYVCCLLRDERRPAVLLLEEGLKY